MTFGQKVNLCRKEKKISQGELGNLVGTSGDIVGKWERDEMAPSIETAKKIAQALDVSLDYLSGLSDSRGLSRETQERILEIDQLPDDIKERVYFFIDMSLRDHRAKGVYRGRG